MKLIFLIIFNFCALSCFISNDTNQELEEFWIDFKNSIYNKDIEGVSKKIEFPLREAQIFVGRYDENGLRKDEFEKAYSNFFNTKVSELIANSSITQLSEDSTNTHLYPNAYKLILELDKDEDEESQLILFLGKVNGEYKIVYIILAE
ncbi:hypothetical protein HZR84_00800 [Hyphobacterium sp. CCMP332]|nr:hypothetical protein HZR84_00800 [Hyphobacterium sp. CCMP332]